MASAILEQLVQNLEHVPDSVDCVYRRLDNLVQPSYTHLRYKEEPPQFEDFTSAILDTCSQHSVVYIVVDALDEFKHKTCLQFITMLRGLTSNGNVRLLATSRNLSEIREAFSSDIPLEIRAQNQDLETYIVGRFPQLHMCVQRDGNLKSEVRTKIITAADERSVTCKCWNWVENANCDSSFLLARLHVDSLVDKKTKFQVQSALEGMPSGPEALRIAYILATRRIDAQSQEDRVLARRAISWLTCAKRPLTAQELCAALAMRPGDRKMSSENIYDIDDVIAVCAGLVVHDVESNIVRFVHYTAHQHFDQALLDWCPHAKEGVAIACLAHMSFDILRRSCDHTITLRHMLRKYPLLAYVVLFWGYHVQPVEKSVAVSQLALTGLKDGCGANLIDQLSTIAQDAGGWEGKFIGSGVSDMHLIAMYGLTDLARKLLDYQLSLDRPAYACSIIDIKNGDRQTALHFAAEHGQQAMVELLVREYDANKNIQDEEGDTPLVYAARGGHVAVVKFMIKHGNADANEARRSYWTALNAAFLYRSDTVVQSLMNLDGFDPNSTNDRGKTILMLAARNGDSDLMKLLIERDGVRVDSLDYDQSHALMDAAESGDEASVQLLLDTGKFDVNSRNSYGQTSLMCAATWGQGKAVKLLARQENINLDLQDRDGKTALMIAVLRKHETTAALLIELGASTNATDKDGKTIMTLTGEQGLDKMERLLDYFSRNPPLRLQGDVAERGSPQGLSVRDWALARQLRFQHEN